MEIFLTLSTDIGRCYCAVSLTILNLFNCYTFRRRVEFVTLYTRQTQVIISISWAEGNRWQRISLALFLFGQEIKWLTLSALGKGFKYFTIRNTYRLTIRLQMEVNSALSDTSQKFSNLSISGLIQQILDSIVRVEYITRLAFHAV